METKQVVINKCYGGFGLSYEAVKRYAQLSGFAVFGYIDKGDYTGYIRAEEGSNNRLIYWLKTDIGDNPTRAELNSAVWLHERDIPRDDRNLVQTVQELGEKANGSCAELKIVEIPANVQFEIDEYDGMEQVAEVHKTWS